MKNEILHKVKNAGVLFIMFGILTFQTTKAQQIPQFTQYMFNNYISNPGVTGTFNYYQMKFNGRYQWIGMNDAPQTFSMSMHGPHSEKSMGWGGYLYNDITGPTSKLGFMGSYAYNMPINNDMRISGGLSFGFMQYKVDGSKLSLGENADYTSDPAIFKTVHGTFTPDASIGFYLYSSQYFVGLSAHQLFGQKLKLYSDPIGVNRLKQHIMLSGSYLISLNRDYQIEPGLLVKFMFNSPFQFELNGKITYKNQMWGGLSFRLRDAISILIGYNYKRKYLFGYSFDYSFTGIRKYQAGSHEIMIGYLFDKIK